MDFSLIFPFLWCVWVSPIWSSNCYLNETSGGETATAVCVKNEAHRLQLDTATRLTVKGTILSPIQILILSVYSADNRPAAVLFLRSKKNM